VDSRAQGNYISIKAVTAAGLQPLKKRNPYPLTIATGQEMPGQGIITHELTNLKLTVQDH
jgi:hypothetical protein